MRFKKHNVKSRLIGQNTKLQLACLMNLSKFQLKTKSTVYQQ